MTDTELGRFLGRRKHIGRTAGPHLQPEKDLGYIREERKVGLHQFVGAKWQVKLRVRLEVFCVSKSKLAFSGIGAPFNSIITSDKILILTAWASQYTIFGIN